MAKNKKRTHSRTVEVKRRAEQEALADQKEKNRKRMDPTARVLLYTDIVFLALFTILDSKGLVSDLADGLCAIAGVILLLAALWFQFGKKGSRGGGKGLRL